MVTFCPRCGAPFPIQVTDWAFTTDIRCADCRLAPSHEPDVLPPSDDGADEVGYELTDWPVTHRSAVTTALIESGTRYRWEDGLVLVVAEAAEAELDALLDELEAQPADEDEEDDGTGDDDDEDGVPSADGGEEAAEAMSDVYLAVDRLQHAPFDAAAARDLRRAEEVVAAVLPPYGIEVEVWGRVATMSVEILAGIDAEAEDEVVAGQAAELRALLREYV